MTILINFPLPTIPHKPLGIYFEQSSIFAGHLNHVGKGVYFGDAEVGAVVENADAFVGEVAAGFVVPVKLVGKTAQEASTLAGNFHGVEGKVLVLGHAD